MKRAVVGAVSTVALVAAAVGVPVGAAQAAPTVTFTTVGTDTYVVPAGVTKVKVEAVGGGGGGWGSGPGGSGCRVSAIISVVAGASVTVGVGGGGSGTGFGGGQSGGGGGSSYFNLTNSEPEANMVIAGGGGGAGFNTNYHPGDACEGGIAAGENAQSSVGDSTYGGSGGSAGTGGDGGNNGAGTIGGSGGSGRDNPGSLGTPGDPAGNGGGSGLGAGGDNCSNYESDPPGAPVCSNIGLRGGVGGTGGGQGGHTGTSGRAGGGAGWGGGGGGANNGSGGAGGSAPIGNATATFAKAGNGGTGASSGFLWGGTGGNGWVTVTPLYSVTYNANNATGGTVPTNSSSYALGDTVTAAANSGALVRSGYTFAGWSTQTNGGGSSYDVGAAILMPANALTLYAKWTASSSFKTLSYDSNGASSGGVPAGSALANGGQVTVAGNSGPLVRPGYTFARWNTKSNGTGTNYSPGATFTMGSSATVLYAQWTANKYAVTYKSNGATGGSVPATSNKATNSTVTAAANSGRLVRTGYTFTGWSNQSNGGGTSYAVGATFLMPPKAVTLFAKWTLASKSKQSQSAGSRPAAISGNGFTVLNTRNAKTEQGLPMSATTVASRGRGDVVCYRSIATPPRGLTVRTFGNCTFTIRVTYSAPGNATYAPFSASYSYRVLG